MTNIFASFTDTKQDTRNYESNELESICFPVSMVPVYWNKNGINDVMPEEWKDAGRQAVLDVLRDEILYVGKDYSIVKNQEIADALEPAFANGFELVRIRNYNNSKFQIELENKAIQGTIVLPNGKELITTGRIRINNSYDGSLSFGLQMGCWIQVCGNGAIAGDVMSMKRRHSGDNELDVQGKIKSGLALLTSDALSVNMNKLSKYWVTPDGKLEEMARGLVRNIPDPKSGVHPIKSQLMNRYTIENNEYGNPAFALFMAVTNMTTYPSQYGITPSYLGQLERNTLEVFK